MNVFRLAGDMTHLLSILVLLLKIRKMKSCAGISLKTQELYAMVFVTRYLDLFTRYFSVYNVMMKLFFIGTSIGIVWYMRYHKVVRQTYNKEEDTFKHYYLIPPCFILALLINRGFNVIEVLWAFSVYLEAVAILPQLLLLQRSRNIDNLAVDYVFLLGLHLCDESLVNTNEQILSSLNLKMGTAMYPSAYRVLYILNWGYRFFAEHIIRWIPWTAGLVQTALYADFFYYYVKSWKNREALKLPG